MFDRRSKNTLARRFATFLPALVATAVVAAPAAAQSGIADSTRDAAPLVIRHVSSLDRGGLTGTTLDGTSLVALTEPDTTATTLARCAATSVEFTVETPSKAGGTPTSHIR